MELKNGHPGPGEVAERWTSRYSYVMKLRLRGIA